MPMRPIQTRLSAAGSSLWFPLDRYANSISVMLGLVFSSNANLTANVQFTTDPLVHVPVDAGGVTRVTTTATLPLTNHGLSVGDSVVVTGAGAPFEGTFAVASVPDQNSITYAVANSGPTSAGSVRVIPLRVQPHEVLTTITTDANSNFAYPPTACRLNVSVYVAGYVDLNIVTGSK